MARKAQVRYFASRNAFYCQHEGRQHKLADGPDDSPRQGPNWQAAVAAYSRLMCTGSAKEGTQEGDNLKFGEMADFYLQYLVSKGKPTKRIRQGLARFLIDYGDDAIISIKPYHVQTWLAAQTTWNDNTGSLHLRYISRVVNFAVKQGRIASNPFKTVERPKETPRGEEFYLSRELRTLLVENLATEWKVVAHILQATGARPIEIEQVEAFNY